MDPDEVLKNILSKARKIVNNHDRDKEVTQNESFELAASIMYLDD